MSLLERKQALYKKIAILGGGISSEREISLMSANNTYQLLRDHFYTIMIDVTHDLSWCEKLSDVDFVFNMLHGQYGEDGRAQSVLDFLGKKYNTSSHYSSAICFNKYLCSMTLKACNIENLYFPNEKLISASQLQSVIVHNDTVVCGEFNIKLPIIIKPVDSGSSIDISIIQSQHDLQKYIQMYSSSNDLLLQQLIHGKEFSTAVVNDCVIGSIELEYGEHLFFDYQCKYNDPYKRSVVNNDSMNTLLTNVSRKIYDELNCKGMARIDYIYDDVDSKLYFLEINTQPGFCNQSIIPFISENKGYSQLDILLMQMQ